MYNILRTAFVALFMVVAIGASAQTYRLFQWGIPFGNYSGITALGDNRFAVVSDNETRNGFYVWQVVQDTVSGVVLNVVNEGFRGVEVEKSRDQEGIAAIPSAGKIWISGEGDQRIIEHNISDGTPTGNELQVPEMFQKKYITSNRGFEALGYDAESQQLWTCTEINLKADTTGLIRLQSFCTSGEPAEQILYRLDEPQTNKVGREHYQGVVAITPLNSDTLLILEREALITQNYVNSQCWNKVFCFNTATHEKSLLSQWSTRMNILNPVFANYEGMCLGKTLENGCHTLLLVSDSQGGYGIAFWRLYDYLKVITLPF